MPMPGLDEDATSLSLPSDIGQFKTTVKKLINVEPYCSCDFDFWRLDTDTRLTIRKGESGGNVCRTMKRLHQI